MQVISYLLLLCGVTSSQALASPGASPSRTPAPRIAVIGAGAAGASTAYHLDKFAVQYGIPLNITVFEREGRPGGRSATVDAYGDPHQPVELGASIFVQVNKILMDAVAEFNLTTSGFKVQDADIAGPELGVWDGAKFVFILEGRSGWRDKARLILRYGLAPVSTIRLMKSTVGKFLRMYDEPVFPWASLTEAAEEVGLLAATAATGEEYMAKNNIVGAFVDEIVQASTRVNYAQNMKHIHGLEAMVCMAAEGAYSVDKGNWLIFEHMLKSSKADKRLNTTVTQIARHDTTYSVTSLKVDDSEPVSKSFDGIVLAVPYQYSGIKFVRAPSHTPDAIPYVQLHVTLFTSPRLLSPEYFNISADSAVPRSVLTTLAQGEEARPGSDGCGSASFWSISLLRAVSNPETGAREYLYKIFSPEPVSATFIDRVLDSGKDSEGPIDGAVSWIYRKVWNSYPYELPRVTFEQIQLDDGLWYTSGIESFISTMETSALMGKNVARLVIDQLREKFDQATYALSEPQSGAEQSHRVAMPKLDL